MKLSKYKIGDRVVAVNPIDGNIHVVGLTGTILHKGEDNVCIAFDESFPEGHDGDGTRPSGRCRFCYDGNEIKLVPKDKLKSSVCKIFTSTTFVARTGTEELYCSIDIPTNLQLGSTYILTGNRHKNIFIISTIKGG